MKKIKNILTVVLPSVIILAVCCMLLLGGGEKYSDSERRLLADKPQMNVQKLSDGSYMSDFESWSQDQFPLRDTFRKLKAFASVKVLRQKDNHKLYKVGSYLSKLEYPADEDKINRSVSVLTDVYNTYIKGKNCKTFLSVISDKNRFLAPQNGYPSMDYEAVINKVKGDLSFAKYIDISPCLALSDFYYSDQHWKQQSITDVAQTLADGMNTEIDRDFNEIQLEDVTLYGAYVGQYALGSSGDEVHYLTNKTIQNCKVYSYSTGSKKQTVMYNTEKAKGRDAYEFFLSGSEPFLEIENPNEKTSKELVIFRDSFCSSLAPLLTGGYSKITLIDLRYMKKELIPSYITFDNQDVLFLYSTLILNNTVSQ